MKSQENNTSLNSSHEFNHPNYINIPFFVLQDDRLDFFNKLLFSFFWSLAVSGKNFTASNNYLASLFKVSDKYVQMRIKELEDMGFILRHKVRFDRVIQVIHIPNAKITLTADKHTPRSTVHPCTKTKLAPTTVGTPHQPQLVPPPTTVGTYNIDILNKDNKPTPKGVDNLKSLFLSLDDLTSCNPHNIPSNLLNEWICIRKKRKAPLTPTAWDRTNKVLSKLVGAGLNAIDCFERMVASGWQGMEFKYFEQDLKPKHLSTEERAANEQKIRERELKAQETKRREIDSAKNFAAVLSTVKTNMSFAEAKKRDEEEMRKLGMSANDYYAHVLKQSHNARA